MEEASGRCIACGAMWLEFSQCGLWRKTGAQWMVHCTEKALQAVSSRLPNKAAWAAWHCGVGVPD